VGRARGGIKKKGLEQSKKEISRGKIRRGKAYHSKWRAVSKGIMEERGNEGENCKGYFWNRENWKVTGGEADPRRCKSEETDGEREHMGLRKGGGGV